MSSASAPVPGSRSIVGSALRNAGLMDRDTQMRDASDNPGGRKGKTRSARPSHRVSEYIMDRTPGTRSTKHPIRASSSAHAGPSDPLSIRGASRPTMAGRIRRNAVSGGSTSTTTGPPTRIIRSTQAIESWREFVNSRWDASKQFLNLDNMNDDPIIKKHSLSPPGHGGTYRDMAVIAKLASQLTPPVTTMSLANNNLSGSLLSQVSRYLPELSNLSLQNNNFRDKTDLSSMLGRGGKFVKLRELLLMGNPLREEAAAAGLLTAYRMDVLRRLPTLEVLDAEAIAKISFDAPQLADNNVKVEAPRAKSFPFDMGPSFVTGVDSETMGGFLVRFFQAFDSDRASLAAVYDPAATFSYSANTAIPTRARIAGFLHSMPNQKKLTWAPWLDNGSRNLSRVLNDPVKMMADLHTGPENIVKTFGLLPQTHHDITGPADKFSLDAFPVPHGTSTGLMVIVHGQFTEVEHGGIRSFDRSFMVVPSPEGSRARQNGWSIMILSDQWTIRAYSSADAWAAGPLHLYHPHKEVFSIKSYPQDQQTALNSLPEAQRELVIQLSAQTRLTASFAVDCLQNNGWDLQLAINNFNQVKASLGPEAYLATQDS